LLPVAVLGPGVEAEAGDRELGVLTHEDRPEVARPAAIGGEAKEFDTLQVHAALAQHFARLRFVRRRLDEDPDRLARRELPDNLTVDPRDRAELAGPVTRVVRPADPGGRVWLPLGGHANAG